MELIKITEENGKQLVSARKLYNGLGYENSQFGRFVLSRIIHNDFAIENTDYVCLDIDVDMPNGGTKKAKDYALTLDFAKKICMLAKTSKGEKFREYFIACEKKLKESTQHQIPQTYSEALMLAAKQAEQIELQDKQIKELAPKGEFYDSVTGSGDTIDIGSVAKVLNVKGIGRNKLFQILRDNNILMRNNQPYQPFIDRGYFRTVEVEYNKPDGSTHINIKTVVFQKGVDYIRKVITKQ